MAYKGQFLIPTNEKRKKRETYHNLEELGISKEQIALAKARRDEY